MDNLAFCFQSRAVTKVYRSLQLIANCILCQTSLRITNRRRQKFPLSLKLLSFKTRIDRIATTTNFLNIFFHLLQYSRQHLFGSQGCSEDKTALTFPAFSLRFVDFAVQFCFCCKFSFHVRPFESSLRGVWFSWTNHNSLLCIATNEITSFCIDLTSQWLCQMAFFMFAKVGKRQLLINDERFWNMKARVVCLSYYMT